MRDRGLVFVLADRSSSRVLMVASEGGWTLPVRVDAAPNNVGFADPRSCNTRRKWTALRMKPGRCWLGHRTN
jgi:hypothetical protein